MKIPIGKLSSVNFGSYFILRFKNFNLSQLITKLLVDKNTGQTFFEVILVSAFSIFCYPLIYHGRQHELTI